MIDIHVFSFIINKDLKPRALFLIKKKFINALRERRN